MTTNTGRSPEVDEQIRLLVLRLAETEAAIQELMQGQVDAVLDPFTAVPILLREAQRALRVSEQRHRGLVEAAPDIIFSLSPEDGTIVALNPAFERITGWVRAEWLGESFTTLVHPADLGTVLDAYERISRGETVPPFEVRVRSRSGEYWIAEIRGSLQIEEGRRVGVLGIARDITERKRAEAMRDLQTQMLETLAKGTPASDALTLLCQALERSTEDARCAIFVVDDDGEHLRLTVAPSLPASYCKAIGRVRIDAVGGSWGTAVYRRETVIVSDIASDLLCVDHRKPALAHGFRACWASPIVATTGEILGAVALHCRESRSPTSHELQLGDLATHLAAIALERERTERERTQLLVREQEARAEAEAAVRARDELLSIVSHDLKNPLTSIKGYAQLLQRQMGRVDWPEAKRLLDGLGAIDTTATKMTLLINELLDFARLQRDQPLELERGPTDLVTIARQTILEHQALTDQHEIRLEARVPELVGTWDSARLERVLTNLLSNAVKYSPDGGQIRVTISREETPNGDWAVVAVQDHGIGIPAADLPHIFERFHRGGNVEGRIRGTGIGLTSARQVIEHHGGTIKVASKEGVGSTFTVRLPIHFSNGNGSSS